MDNAVSGKVPILPFRIGDVLDHEKAVDEQNQVLFELASIDSLRSELQSYFATL